MSFNESLKSCIVLVIIALILYSGYNYMYPSIKQDKTTTINIKHVVSHLATMETPIHYPKEFGNATGEYLLIDSTNGIYRRIGDYKQ